MKSRGDFDFLQVGIGTASTYAETQKRNTGNKRHYLSEIGGIIPFGLFCVTKSIQLQPHSNPIQPTHTPTTTTTKKIMKIANSSTSSSSSSSSSLNDSSFDIVLPSSFVPGPHHVICARGKAHWDHEGNKSYRAMIAASARKYAKSGNSKLDKSIIVSEIIHALHHKAAAANDSDYNDCCFVKQQQHHEKGATTTTTWVQCNEQFAREKVSQSLRDALHGQYRSSFTAKKQRRTHASDTIIAKVEQVILSNASIARQIQKMTHDLLQCSSETTSSASLASLSSSEHNNDSSIFTTLSLANLDILESLKKDSSFLSQFQKATCC
jgi:hypothetical protein